TILRLPNGTFTPYSQGVKANAVFLRKGLPTRQTWIYDARTNVERITKKGRPLTPEHFAGFESAYGPRPNADAPRHETDRFRPFTLDQIKVRAYNLDITWLRDDLHQDSNTLPDPADLAAEAITELETAVDELQELVRLLESDQLVTVEGADD
ncbi:MAG: N-6 DNA methylase, partial [Dehalococcoidia bacterium]